MAEPMSEPISYLDQSEAVKNRLTRMKARDVILQVEGLTKTFRAGSHDVTALENISFKTHKREFLCIIGPSGCGKSTLVRILAGLETASSGQVLLDGRPVKGPGRERGMVFQGYGSQECDVRVADE
jgi:NitT/TauT family transport system ATP-binding protein